MAKFRKKPVVIEAHQWFKNGDHPLDYEGDKPGYENGELRTFSGEYRREQGWEGDVVRYFRHPEVAGESLCSECGVRFHEHGWIDTLEDGHRVCPSDWIITGIAGERYPCKNQIFRDSYEPADEEAEKLWNK
jgi:hypothetical protein